MYIVNGHLLLNLIVCHLIKDPGATGLVVVVGAGEGETISAVGTAEGSTPTSHSES
ncbi:unnamed protein product [marine sediment metagenome]|uniref:Uncharacterized protein n=1 Tax=marine sediment metagenome TaxID=412755 RepID=X0TY78_9ZZZZ